MKYKLTVMGIFLYYTILPLSECRGPHHPGYSKSHHHHQQPYNHPQPSSGKKLLKDDNLLHDKQHIVEDLGEWSEPIDMSEEEMEFRYFTAHDYDNNTKLDGLEMYHAIKHSMESNSPSVSDSEYWNQKESTIIDLIDQVLTEDDLNNDGYLSYVEFIIGRERGRRKQG